MLHHLRCPLAHRLDLPHEAEQPGRLLTCLTCGWSVNMFGKSICYKFLSQKLTSYYGGRFHKNGG